MVRHVLVALVQVHQGDAVVAAVAVEGCQLLDQKRVGDGRIAPAGRHRVVGDGHGAVGAADGAAGVLRGKLAGIGEIRINNGTNTFRVYVWLGCEPALYVLDAGIRSQRLEAGFRNGSRTGWLIARNRAAADCKHSHADLSQAFLERAAQRDRHEPEASR